MIDLEKFVNAQNSCYSSVLKELKSGQKITCWMWFVFPQIFGLGQSEASILYSIKSRDECLRYLDHEILGKRLIQCTQLTLDNKMRSAKMIFGEIDSLKFHSSMTLFSIVCPGGSIYSEALDSFFDGKDDGITRKIMEKKWKH